MMQPFVPQYYGDWLLITEMEIYSEKSTYKEIIG